MAATEGNDTLSGTAGNDIIDGLGGDDEITGGLGADTVSGGAGRDRFIIRGGPDVAAGEAYSGGDDYDTLMVRANGVDISLLTIGADVEGLSVVSPDYGTRWDVKLTAAQLNGFHSVSARNVTVTTAGVIDLTGIVFSASAITLGMGGVELYLPDVWFGVGKVHGSDGADRVRGRDQDDVIEGNGGDDIIDGNFGEDILHGGAGNDVLSGGLHSDRLIGGAGIDRLDGGDGDDTLVLSGTGDGQDRFDGGLGYDVLSLGGEGLRLRVGNLVERVEELRSQNAVTIDAIMIGKFSVISADGLTIATAGNVDARAIGLWTDTITLGVGGITLNRTGQIGTTIVGSNGNDRVIGGDGDTIGGRGGDDVIVGGAGVNRIDGGGGLDNINAGYGDDVVTIAAAAHVVAGERYIGGGGSDSLVLTGANIDLTAAVVADFEILNATGRAVKLTTAQLETFERVWAGSVVIADAGRFRPDTANIHTQGYTLAVGGITLDLSADRHNGYLVRGSADRDVVIGGGGADKVYGYDGDDILQGGRSGGDVLSGGGGDDTYIVISSLQRVVEGSAAGHDAVHTDAGALALTANVEDLIYIGQSWDGFRGTGNGGDNLIVAGALNDVLRGLAGDDSLHGGHGSDQLTGGDGADRFVFDTALSADRNVDRILDFAADDFIVLDRDVFAAAGPFARPARDAFFVGAGARDAEDRIVYDQATGRLFYDADGNGAVAQILFATVKAGTELTAADFQIVG